MPVHLLTEDSDIGRAYKDIEKIGEGSFGIVFKAVDKQTKQLVALKKIQIDKYVRVESDLIV